MRKAHAFDDLVSHLSSILHEVQVLSLRYSRFLSQNAAWMNLWKVILKSSVSSSHVWTTIMQLLLYWVENREEKKIVFSSHDCRESQSYTMSLDMPSRGIFEGSWRIITVLSLWSRLKNKQNQQKVRGRRWSSVEIELNRAVIKISRDQWTMFSKG